MADWPPADAWCHPHLQSCDPSGRPRHQCSYHEGWSDALDVHSLPDDLTTVEGWWFCHYWHSTPWQDPADCRDCPGPHQRIVLLPPVHPGDDDE